MKINKPITINEAFEDTFCKDIQDIIMSYKKEMEDYELLKKYETFLQDTIENHKDYEDEENGKVIYDRYCKNYMKILRLLCKLDKYNFEYECLDFFMYGIEITIDMEVFNENFKEIKELFDEYGEDIYMNYHECKGDCLQECCRLASNCKCKGAICYIEL